MVPTSPCSISRTPCFITSFAIRKNEWLARCSSLRRFSQETLFPGKLILSLPASVIIFPSYRSMCVTRPEIRTFISSVPGTNVPVDEQDSQAKDITLGSPSGSQTSEEPSMKTNASEAPAQVKRLRPGRKSDMPPVSNEALIPGATFTGKVKSIQPFGAFVDIGAFTDGLVHISKVSDKFVKNIGSFVSVGQEVQVRLVEADTVTGRISLTMRENGNASTIEESKDVPESDDKPRPATRDASTKKVDNKKTSIFVKGQEIRGTVKKLTGSGSFISLPEGEEGFLPKSTLNSEEMGDNRDPSLRRGQEITVRVLRITNGYITLAMTTGEEKVEELKDEEVTFHQGVVHKATNPFELAFRKIKEIAAFLNEVEKMRDTTDTEEISTTSAETSTLYDASFSKNVDSDSIFSSETDGLVQTIHDQVEITTGNIAYNDTTSNENQMTIKSSEISCVETDLEPNLYGEITSEILSSETVISKDGIGVPVENNLAYEMMQKPPDPQTEISPVEMQNTVVMALDAEQVKIIPDEIESTSSSNGQIDSRRKEELIKKGLASADQKSTTSTTQGRISSYIHDSRIGVLIEVNCESDSVSRGDIFNELAEDLAMQVAACPQVQHVAMEDVPEEVVKKETEIEMQKEDLLSKPEQMRSKIVEGRIRKRLQELALVEQAYIKNDKILVKDWVKQTIGVIGENIKVKRFVRYTLGEGLQKKGGDFAAEVAAAQSATPQPGFISEKKLPATVDAEETTQKSSYAIVPAALVRQLRAETGAGMMDCKRALSSSDLDLEKAQLYLRKKGLSTADKKSGRAASEGRVGSYLHGSQTGSLIEVNCETDFVGRSEIFKKLVDDLAMQVVACPQAKFVRIEDVPEDLRERGGEFALLEQRCLGNEGVLVKEMVKERVGALGENIRVRRFVRFCVGEEDVNVSS